MPLNNVKEGPVKEMLSIPLQQTARYIREYYEDITEDEAVILEAVFEEELEVIGEEYEHCYISFLASTILSIVRKICSF